MTNYEMFEGYWNEACNSTVYYLRNSSQAVMSKEQVNDIWRRELLNKRFRCEEDITHGAKRFLDGLIESNPEIGGKVLKLLEDSSLEIGCKVNGVAAGAGISAASAIIGGFAGSQGSQAGQNGKKALSGLAVLGITAGLGVAGISAYSGIKNTLINEFEKKSAERLEVFKRVLD